MKREILFKAKRIDNAEWVEGMLLTNKLGSWIVDETNPHFCHEYGYIEVDNPKQVNPETVCQCTGVVDKKGNKIFEGDQLFICAGYSSTVEFQDAMFVSVYVHPEDGEVIPLLDAIGKDSEIIGNIHD